MFATHWQPVRVTTADWNRLRSEMERALERLAGAPARQRSDAGFPALNVWEEDGRFLVEAELPGLELEELEIYVDGDNQLTLKGERKAPELKNGAWHRQERGFGKFVRTLQLPHDVDCNGVTAQYKQGVLTVMLPKAEAVKSRRIKIQA